jgi:hypothetical protein
MIQRLLAAGYSPVALSLALRIDLDAIVELDPDTSKRDAPDDLIQDGLRILAWRTIEEASRILDEGTPALKLQLIKTFGSQMKDILGTRTSDEKDELKEQLDEILREMRGGIELVPDPTGEATDYQNEGPPVDTNQT